MIIFLIFLNAFAGIDDWQEIKPGGNTSCARGSEFSFFLHPGDPSHLIIDFVGGGACWNEETCQKNSQTFTDSISAFKKDAQKNLNGIYDKKNPKNPFKNWMHVVIPPCTGDIFLGEKDFDYGKFKIRHRGATNVKAVLKYVEENFQNPQKILVSGCSGGSYGAIYWTPHIKNIYPGSKIYQFGDSGAGVITRDFFENHAIKNWDIWKNVARWIPGIDPQKTSSIISLYKVVGDYYPDLRMSQFNYSADEVQRTFFQLMGGQSFYWNDGLGENLTRINLNTDNFHYFVADGHDHCILPYKEFYTVKTWGVSLRQWLLNLVSDKPLKNYVCPYCF